MKNINLQIGRDVNGNKVLRVSGVGFRSFTVQTLDNLPDTNANGVTGATLGELRRYVAQFGTARQKAVANA